MESTWSRRGTRKLVDFLVKITWIPRGNKVDPRHPRVFDEPSLTGWAEYGERLPSAKGRYRNDVDFDTDVDYLSVYLSLSPSRRKFDDFIRPTSVRVFQNGTMERRYPSHCRPEASG